ncbi:MAG: transketolase [Candidatus Omnitrophica bacterium]|nr:transketolase [Candidatus Omnitrophota bacterium]
MPAAGNYRKDVLDMLLPYFRKDERYYLLMCDMGFGVDDKLRNEFPKRIINCGIMEQGTVGIAAGMSMSGLIPIVYSIVNFLVYRCLEQMRNDVVLHDLNVKFISTGANDYFKFLGPTHCCGHDDVALMKLINVRTYDPYADRDSFRRVIEKWINYDKAAYIRV